MIFDIPASIGSKRRYLVINGVDIEPFEFPALGTEGYTSSYSTVKMFKVSRSEAQNAITLNIETEYSSDLYASYIGTGRFYLKELLSSFDENIEDYSKISFVVSSENYNSPMGYSIASLTYQHHTSLNYGDVERKSISIMDDGDKSIYKFNLKSFYDLDYMLIRFYLYSNHAFDADQPPKLHIHAIYLE